MLFLKILLPPKILKLIWSLFPTAVVIIQQLSLINCSSHLQIDHIGFVDADCATAPTDFYALLQNIDGHDGIIASRYMPGAHVTPARPLIKRWGSKIFFHGLIRCLF